VETDKTLERDDSEANSTSHIQDYEEDKRMTTSTLQNATIARAVGEATPVAPTHTAEVLKVSTRSRPSAVAGAIAGVIRESGVAEVQSIGAGATNQAIKAVAIARSYLSEEGVDIVCVPSFIDVAIDEEERTAIRLLIERR
jgi:stage V sporulation protein S